MNSTKLFIGLILFLSLTSCYEYHIQTEDHVVLNNVKIYPNPTVDVLVVEVENKVDNPVTYRIINPSGQVSKTGQLDFSMENQQFIEVGHFSTGYYSLELSLNKVDTSLKFLKQR